MDQGCRCAVAQRRRVERQEPQAVHPEPLQVVQLLDQASQVAGAIGIGVVERPHQHLVEDGTFEPGPVGGQASRMPEIPGGGMLDGPSRRSGLDV